MTQVLCGKNISKYGGNMGKKINNYWHGGTGENSILILIAIFRLIEYNIYMRVQLWRF